MPNITYILRFALRDSQPGTPYEEQEHTTLSNAWEAFWLFAEPDSADMYTRIELVAYDWQQTTETSIASMDFTRPDSF